MCNADASKLSIGAGHHCRDENRWHLLYQELIGVWQWAVELGRIVIKMVVSVSSSHLALPSKGHLQQVHHMFGYLKAKPKKTLAFDLLTPTLMKRDLKAMIGIIFTNEQRNQFQGTRQNHEVMLSPLTVLLMPITQVTESQGDCKLGSSCFVIVLQFNGTVSVTIQRRLPHLGVNLLQCILPWSLLKHCDTSNDMISQFPAL
jgi:hypothetical protein